MELSYPTDLSHEKGELISPLLPAPKNGGRPRSVDLRAILNAIFYIVVAGCAWRMMPKDFPKWKTVYHYFRSWRLDGTWDKFIVNLCSGNGLLKASASPQCRKSGFSIGQDCEPYGAIGWI